MAADARMLDPHDLLARRFGPFAGEAGPWPANNPGIEHQMFGELDSPRRGRVMSVRPSGTTIMPAPRRVNPTFMLLSMLASGGANKDTTAAHRHAAKAISRRLPRLAAPRFCKARLEEQPA